MIRQFKLYNSVGDTIDFLNNLDFFGVNPEGLGVSFSNSFYGANANFNLSSQMLNQGQFKIQILFGAETLESYQRYSEFINVLNKPPFTLEYETIVGKWHRDCELSELSKGEIGESNILIEDFILDFTTPFYKEIAEKIEIQPEQLNDGKIYVETPIKIVTQPEHHHEYDYEYDFVYGVPIKKKDGVIHAYSYDYVYEDYHNGSDGVFTINNESRYLNSSIGSPIEIEVEGPCENPYWQIKKGSRIIQEDGFFLTIPEGFKLVVSSIPQEQRAVIVAPDGTESNVYQQQDLSKSNFVTIPTGQSQLLFFNCTKVAFKYREESVVV